MGKSNSKNKRKPKIEISAGGVVLRKTKRGVSLLLIKDSYGRWALPKGKMEKEESPEETALREIKEETGLNNLKIKGYLGKIKYFYTLENQPIFKIVHHFLLETNQAKLNPSWEVKSAKWVSLEKGIKKIAYKNTIPILKKAARMWSRDETT